MQDKTPKSCVFWPDKKPLPKNDKTGQRNGRLTFIQPVYYEIRQRVNQGNKWYWLSVCDCGGETIVCNPRQTLSCGCLAKERRKEGLENYLREKSKGAAKRKYVRRVANGKGKPEPVKTIKTWSRFKNCTRNHGVFICKHYSQCQNERIDTGKLSTRWKSSGGQCYTATQAEVAAMANQ